MCDNLALVAATEQHSQLVNKKRLKKLVVRFVFHQCVGMNAIVTLIFISVFFYFWYQLGRGCTDCDEEYERSLL